MTAHGRGIPSPKLGNQRRLRAVAGPKGEFVTALPCYRSCMGRLELFSVTSRDRLSAVRLPFPSFRRHGRSGFPVRVGCSRTVMVPRWVLVPLVFQRPSFEDRLSSLVLRSFLRPNASQGSPSKPLSAGDKASLRESPSAAGEPSCVGRVAPSWRTKSGGNRCLSFHLGRGLSRGPWVLPFDLLADTKKGQVCLKPKKIDFPKLTSYPPHLQTIVDIDTRGKCLAFGAAKVQRRRPVSGGQARKKRKLTVAGKVEGNVRLCSACISSPASAAMASKTGISKMYWSEKPWVAS